MPIRDDTVLSCLTIEMFGRNRIADGHEAALHTFTASSQVTTYRLQIYCLVVNLRKRLASEGIGPYISIW